jgi:hypothetical protein
VRPPEPPHGIGHHIKFPWAPEIKAVAIIPEFEVPTAKAREVLPAQYPRTDVVSLFQCMGVDGELTRHFCRHSTCSG